MRLAFLAYGLCIGLAGLTLPATAATLTVTSAADHGSGVCAATCTLRDAIASAAPGDTISFADSLTYPATITLGGQELLLYKDLTVLGPGAAKLTIDANQQSRIFEITNGTTVTISGLRLINGQVTGARGSPDLNGGNANGGAIFVDADSTLQIERCVLAGNLARGGHGWDDDTGTGDGGGDGGTALGGAIDNAGSLSIYASTLAYNQAVGGFGGFEASVQGETGGGNGGAADGGAIYSSGLTDIADTQLLSNMAIAAPGASTLGAAGPGAAGGNAAGGAIAASGFLAISFVTAAGNTTTGGAGAQGRPYYGANGSASGADLASSATLLSRYSVLVSTGSAPDCAVASVSTQGLNIAHDSSCNGFNTIADPKLEIIDATPAPIAYPLWGSPLIDAAADCKDAFGTTLATDVRGVTRPLDGNADGAAACDLGAVESDELFANSFE